MVDRCFLLELSQVNWDAADPPELSNFVGLPILTGLPEVSISSASSDEQVRNVLEALHRAVQVHELRPDLLPSRRVLTDIKATLSLHHRLDLQGKGLLDRIDLIDRLIASRILVKLSGAFDQIGPALEALEAAVEGIDELPRTRRRLKLARQQIAPRFRFAVAVEVSVIEAVRLTGADGVSVEYPWDPSAWYLVRDDHAYLDVLMKGRNAQAKGATKLEPREEGEEDGQRWQRWNLEAELARQRRLGRSRCH